jgi:hypothetical protein
MPGPAQRGAELQLRLGAFEQGRGSFQLVAGGGEQFEPFRPTRSQAKGAQRDSGRARCAIGLHES